MLKYRKDQLLVEPVILGILIALAVGGLLAAKGGSIIGRLNNLTISQSTVDAAREAHLAYQGFVVYYRCVYDNSPTGCVTQGGQKIAQNRCPTGGHGSLGNLCAERPVLNQLQALNTTIETQINTLQTDLSACAVASGGPQCSGLNAAYTAVKDALNAGAAIAAQFGFQIPTLGA